MEILWQRFCNLTLFQYYFWMMCHRPSERHGDILNYRLTTRIWRLFGLALHEFVGSYTVAVVRSSYALLQQMDWSWWSNPLAFEGIRFNPIWLRVTWFLGGCCVCASCAKCYRHRELRGDVPWALLTVASCISFFRLHGGKMEAGGVENRYIVC